MGIGNLYKTESLFLHATTPWTPVGAVPDLPRLVDRAARLLAANKETESQVTTGDPRRGRGHWAFERAGRPCLRCGTPIASAEQGRAPYQRISYWCPTCQRGPAPAPAPPVRRADRPAGRTRYRP